MSFTDTERVILANQYEILGKLGNEQAYPIKTTQVLPLVG